MSHTKKSSLVSLPALRLEHLWVLLALSVVGFFIGLVPTSPNDFWWHLKAGQLIATEGLPHTNLFAWTLPTDTPYIYQSWLGEWLFYALYNVGSFPLVVFARNMLGTGVFALVAYESRRRSGSWRLAAGVVLLAAAMSLNNLTTRTQNWSWIPFVVTFILLSRYSDGNLRPRWLVLSPVIMLFWVNAHGAFVMGVLLFGAFAVGETIRKLMRQVRVLTWERLRWLYLAGVATLIATLFNPLGVGIFGYVQAMLGDIPSQSLINEWQSPTPRTIAGMFFYLGVLVVIASFAFARTRPSVTDVLLVCGLAWQAFVGTRYVVWFALVAMPIVAQSFAKPRSLLKEKETDTTASSTPRRLSGRERGGGAVGNLAVALVLLLAVVAVQPWLKPMLPLPQPYRNIFAPMHGAPLLFSNDTPVGAADHLYKSPCKGNLFNEMGYGSYLNWALYPQSQVFIDPRVELYPLKLWNDYVDITRGYQTEALLNEYDIACVILDVPLQPRLAELLATKPGWQRTYQDQRSEVWRKGQTAGEFEEQ